ncbi:MAG: hypothetical protein QXM16_03775 [Nitrososphaerota archaeon]
MEFFRHLGVLAKPAKCIACGKDLTGLAVQGYPHSYPLSLLIMDYNLKTC